MENANTKSIILFDGVCNLCNGAVNWIIARDKKQRFRFAPLQGPFAKRQLNRAPLIGIKLESIVLLQNGKILTKSTAALHIAKQLKGLWPVLFVFIIIPPIIRNAVYNFIAKNRYRWFGKRESCMVPTPENKALFIE